MKPTKNRKKSYRPKLCVLPLGIRNAQKLEYPGFAASLVLGTEHFDEQHLYDLLSNADLTRRIAPDGHPVLEHAQTMVQAIAEIQSRAQRLGGKLGVTGDELQTLRTGLGRTMDFMRNVPNVAIARASLAAVTKFEKKGLLRV